MGEDSSIFQIAEFAKYTQTFFTATHGNCQANFKRHNGKLKKKSPIIHQLV
jgi:hypothetical protein